MSSILTRASSLLPVLDKACSRLAAVVCAAALLSATLSAQTLSGTVTDRTTGNPAKRDEVALLSLGDGMREVAHTRSDALGRFSFRLPYGGPYLIRAIHRGAPYYRPIPAGSGSIEVEVFDVAKKIDGISVTADVMRFQAQGDELQGIRLFAVNNASNPPRTQMNGEDFDFFLPDGARIDQATAMSAGGEPVHTSPVVEREKDRYGFRFPLRPGETELQVAFHMKYGGEVSIDPKALHSAQHFVVMVPKTMRFTAAPGVAFQSMEDPRQADALVRVVSNTGVGQPLNFKISGSGTLTEPGDDSQGAPHPVQDQVANPPGRAVADVRADRAPERYRWYILCAVTLLLAMGTIYWIRRPRTSGVARAEADGREPPGTFPDAPSHRSESDLRLQRLKDRLFQLEVARQQGHISQLQYDRDRAALHRALDRTIKRAPRK